MSKKTVIKTLSWCLLLLAGVYLGRKLGNVSYLKGKNQLREELRQKAYKLFGKEQ